MSTFVLLAFSARQAILEYSIIPCNTDLGFCHFCVSVFGRTVGSTVSAIVINTNKVSMWVIFFSFLFFLPCITSFLAFSLPSSYSNRTHSTELVKWPPPGSEAFRNEAAVLLLTRIRLPCAEGLLHNTINNGESNRPSQNN